MPPVDITCIVSAAEIAAEIARIRAAEFAAGRPLTPTEIVSL